MAQPKIIGEYRQESAENLELFYAAIGVSYYYGSIMSTSILKLTIDYENTTWTISSFGGKSTNSNFKLGSRYSECVEGLLKNFQSVTVLDGEVLKTISVGKYNGSELSMIRCYHPTDTGCTLILTHPTTGSEARRIFVREA